MEAVPRLPMICCDMKISPQNTEFGSTLKKYIRDHYHEDPESYTKEIKELETLRQNAIKAPMDFTGCSILKRYYSQLHKLQNRFPMTDDGPACVPFMWTDIYSGVAYNITDIEYEEACILYNIGALHSKLGTMDSRCNAEGMKIACTHFQCSAWAFQNLRDTYPQPKGSDMSHDLLTFFINIMLAQAQECILEKSMLDNRKSSITAKIAAQVVDYYKCALGIMVSGSPSTDTGSILDIVGSKIFKSWKKFIEFKMAYYTSISHLYMGNQAEENEKWGERVAWFQSAFDHLTEAFKIAKNIDREDLNEPLTFTMDVIGGKHSSSKKENEFVYHDKVPVLSSLPDLKGASLVKGIPFSITDPDVSGPDIFARLVPMEAHETSSLYSEEKAKILRSMVSKIEGKNEELMAYLSSLQLESGTSFDDNDKIPQELLEKCAAMSVRPNFISDLEELMKELINVSKDVDAALKSTFALLSEEEKKELQHQETFGKRVASMLTTELKKECSKYDEAHKKAIESNNTLETAVSIHINNISKLLLPLEDLAAILPSAKSLKTPENQKAMDSFNHLVDKVEEMRKQRQYLEQQLRDSLMNDDITKNLVTMKKKEDLQQTFSEELKKHEEIITYLDQNLSAQDNILCALTEANAHYAETRKAVSEIKHQRQEMVNALINSFEAYDDIVSKAKKGLEFYQKLQTNVTRLLTRVRSVTKVQDEERSQITEAELRKGPKMPRLPTMPPTQPQHVPKLKDYLPYMTKQGGTVSVTPGIFNSYPPQQPTPPVTQLPSEPIRQATLGGSSIDAFDRKLKPFPKENARPDEGFDVPSMGVRPTPVGSEQPSVPAMCTTTVSSSQIGTFPVPSTQQWPQNPPASAAVNSGYTASYMPYQYPTSVMNSSVISTPGAQASNVAYSQPPIPNSLPSQNYNPNTPNQNVSSQSQIPRSLLSQNYRPAIPNANVISQPQIPSSIPSQNYNPAISSQNVSPLQHDVKLSHQPSVSSVTAPQSTNVPRFGIAQNEVNAVPTSLPQPFVNTSIRPYVPVAGSASNTMTYPSGTNLGAYQYARDSIPQNVGYIPQSRFTAPQQIGNTPTSSLTSPSLPQTQMHPSMQGTVQLNPYAAIPNYTTSSLYGQKPLPDVSNYQPSQPSPYYQTNTRPASVTASMDTRTTTFNSSIPYSNPNTIPSSQPSSVASQIMPSSAYNYSASTPSQLYGQYSPQTSVSPSIQANFPNTNNVPPSSVPSSHPYPNNYGSATFPNQSTYYSFVPQNVQSMPAVSSTGLPGSNAPVATYTGTSMPMVNYAGTNIAVQKVPTGFSPVQAVNQQLNVANTSVAPQPSSGSFHNQNVILPSSGTSFSGQQSSHSTNMVSQYNYPANHAGYTSSVPNVQYQASTQPVALPCQPLQPIPAQSITPPPCQPLQPTPTQSITPPPCQSLQPTPTNVQNIPELKSPSSNADQSIKNEVSHINAIRDLITPPLEVEPVISANSTEKETLPQVLQPKIIDLKSIAQPKEKEPVKDPLDDPSVRSKFVAEVEKYEKFVDGLVRKSLNGTTPLDQKWKEFIDTQDKESRKLSISVARCYPLKNRFPDVMPYDSNRVQLSSAKDDYINASYLKDICPDSPVFLITQAPLPATFSDFWLMIWEQQVETLVCLLPDSELKNHVYFPKERGSPSSYGAFETTLQSYKEKNGFIERMINITHIKNRTSRVVVHLQFTQWPASGIPQSPAPLLQFISDVLSYHKQQRNLMRPVAVHCSAGIGRSGCFSLITALVNEMNNGHGPRDVAVVGTIVSQQRKFLIQDKEQLKFCYDTVLYYAQDLLMKRGILTSRASFEDKLPVSGSTSSHVRHPSEDFILGSGGLAKLQSGMEKLGLVPNQQNLETENISTETTIDGNSPSHNGSGDVSAENLEPIDSTTPEPTEKVTSPESVPEPSKDNKGNLEKPLPSITSLLDPSNFTLDGTGSPAKKKITKDNFACSRGSLSTSSSDSADPLSLLDPLWSLKK